MDVIPGFKYMERCRERLEGYMPETKIFISKINFKLKFGNEILVPFNGQSNTFRLRYKEVYFLSKD